jgi:hypothetical protein
MGIGSARVTAVVKLVVCSTFQVFAFALMPDLDKSPMP